MKKLIVSFFLFINLKSFSQDSTFARKMVDTLTSKVFWGRGYTKNGMQNAANFLAEKFTQFGLQPMKGKSYFQEYSFSVNTFPERMTMNINDKELEPGKDFIVAAESRGLKAGGKLEQTDSITFVDKANRLIVKLENKLTMDVAQRVEDYTIVQVDKKSISSIPVYYQVTIDNKFIKNFEANNICGIVKGTVHPDSIIMITAHYDHLGGLGKDTYFPGANDNASGVSLLLNLARYYAKNPQPYSIGFILFSGEEAGLMGSKYFTQNPLINLKNIKFLVNTDLAGTGVDGITVVNATEFTKEFKIMQDVNAEYKLLKAINPRGKAANSDHYFFTEKGVPSFFFYTLGGITAYHDVFDVSATLPLNKHEALFKLIVKFSEKLMGL
ncbi:MAG: M28 family metallopeptidase [Chitinophagaceae bacterium]